MKRALILGVGGMDGSHLADLLLDKGYSVHGLYRRTSTGNLSRVAHLTGRITLHCGDLTDTGSLYRVLREVQPDLLFNEADQDHVGTSFDMPATSVAVTYGAVCAVLEAVRRSCPECRVFQPASATMFGDAPPPQNEQTSLNPLSPYAVAKAAAYHAARMYRQVHGLWVATAILYNHDSERRGEGYLLHRIARQAVEVARGNADAVRVGDSTLRVDVGYAPEYADGICRIMERPAPDDYILATGEPWTLMALAVAAIDAAGAPGSTRLVGVGETFDRPDVKGRRVELVGNANKARDLLGWRARSDAGKVLDRLVHHYSRG